MSLEEQITAQLNKQVNEAIDWQATTEYLAETGWTKIVVEYGAGNTWVDMITWADKNCGVHREHMGTWVFENPADATWFRLRWL